MAAWKGYYLLIINSGQPQSVIDDCITALGLSGKTLTSDLPNEKTTIRLSVDALKYIIECDCEMGTPTLSSIKSDCLDGSGRTEQEVDDLLDSITVFDDDADCRNYINSDSDSNGNNWNAA